MDWIWTGYRYIVRGIALATERDGNWFESLRRLPRQRSVKRNYEGDIEAGASRGRPANIIVASGALANDADNKEIMARVARVWETLPDSVGIVAVVGLVLKASTVGALAEEAEFEEYIVIVGPSCVVTSYQIGLVALSAFSVVNDLSPTTTGVHPSIPKTTGSDSISLLVVRAFTSLFAMAFATYGTIAGWMIPAVVAFLTNVVSSGLLRACTSPKKGATDASPDIGGNSTEEIKSSEEAVQSNEEESPSWALDDAKRKIWASAPYAISGVFYGLSTLPDMTGTGVWMWMSWVCLALGVLSNALLLSSGEVYSPLTAWMSGLIVPLFVVFWVIVVAGAVALVPLSAILFSCLIIFLVFVSPGDMDCTGFIVPLLCAFLVSLVFILPHVLIVSWLIGIAIPSWALYVSSVGWIVLIFINIGIEVELLGASLVTYKKVVEKVKERAIASGKIGNAKKKLGDGFGHKSKTGLHVRFIPCHTATNPRTESAPEVDILVGDWYWRGGIAERGDRELLWAEEISSSTAL